MMLHTKSAKGLLWVAFIALLTSAAVFATGKNGIALIVLATAVVGYLIYEIGKSGLPGTESEREQDQKELAKHPSKDRAPTHP
jgi:hypothetical protein